MKRLRQLKGNLSLFFILAILVLCAGFFIVSCGNKPQQKTKNANLGAYAIDFSQCPSGKSCIAYTKGNSLNPVTDISNNAVTLEAWVKTSLNTTSGNIFDRADVSNGVKLSLDNNAPQFTIRYFDATGIGVDTEANRTVFSECVWNGATSTECVVSAISQVGSTTTGVAATFTIPTTTPTTTLNIISPIYVNSSTIVSSFTDIVGNIITLIGETANSIIVPVQTVTAGSPTTIFDVTNVTALKTFPETIDQDAWAHIAGVITRTDQSSGPGNCATDLDGNGIVQGAEVPHLAIYINGALNNCASTNEKFAGNPGDEELHIGMLPEAVVDELRLWVPGRTQVEINNCMNTELGIGGVCDRGNPALAAYYRLNEGEGAGVTDFSGNGFSGSWEYRVSEGVFHEWEDGWVTPGVPITPAD